MFAGWTSSAFTCKIACMTLSVLLAEALDQPLHQPGYYVVWHTYVDYPEKRSDTHRERTRDVKPVIPHQKIYPTDSKNAKAKAMAHAKALLDGDEDFGSEYTRAVEVYYRGDGQASRQIMKKVRRERGEDGKIRVNPDYYRSVT